MAIKKVQTFRFDLPPPASSYVVISMSANDSAPEPSHRNASRRLKPHCCTRTTHSAFDCLSGTRSSLCRCSCALLFVFSSTCLGTVSKFCVGIHKTQCSCLVFVLATIFWNLPTLAAISMEHCTVARTTDSHNGVGHLMYTLRRNLRSRGPSILF